jgi:hypothetical protein
MAIWPNFCGQIALEIALMTKSVASFCLFVALALSGCTKPDPLAELTPDDKAFLFADTGTNAPFLGQAVDNGPLNCYPQRMNQGYAFVDTATDLWLDSIRPSGVERHKILSVAKIQNGFVVKGQNGVSVNFNLIIERQGTDRALISWDGAKPELYRRCERAGD